MTNQTPPPGERGYSQDPNQEYGPRYSGADPSPEYRDPGHQWPTSQQKWQQTRPTGPNRNKMPWYGWLILALAGMGTLLLIALFIVAALMPTDTPDAPAAASTATAAPSESVDETGDDVIDEAGGQDALKEAQRPVDQSLFLNKVLELNPDAYDQHTAEQLILMGEVVCSAYDDGDSTVRILTYFPESMDSEARGAIVAGAVRGLCVEHLGDQLTDVERFEQARS